MKILFCLMAIISFTECGEKTSSEPSVEPTATQIPNSVNEEGNLFVYEATTRGFYEKIWVDKESISVTNDRDETEISRFPTPESDWNELMHILSEIDVSNLPNLEAPTAKREYDGAAIATLIIKQNREETTSNSFDHGHPPKAIEALVNKVLSMGKGGKKD